MCYNLSRLGKHISHDWRSHDTIPLPSVSTYAVCLDNIPPLTGGIVIRSIEMGRANTRQDFEAHIDKSGDCWLWMRHTNKSVNGYGEVRYEKRKWRAHRLMWVLTHGEIPDGLHVCHKCDNPLCVKPDHLFLGTIADNAHDRDRKGRNYHGTDCHTAKLNDETVRAIRLEYAANKCKYPELAAKYGVSVSAISDIVLGITWKHVK